MRSLVIRVRSRESGDTQTHSFQRSPVRIGRNDLNDLTLPFAFVSGWHGIIRFDYNEATYYDLGSTNGTILNGRKLSTGEALSLSNSTSLQIGQLDLTFIREEEATIAPISSSSPHRPSPSPASPPSPNLAQADSVQGSSSSASASFDTDDAIPRRKSESQETSEGATSFLNLSRIHATIRELREQYAKVQPTIDGWICTMEQSLQALSAPEQEAARAMTAREFPLSYPRSSTSSSSVGANPLVNPGSPANSGEANSIAQTIFSADFQPRSAEEKNQLNQRLCEVLDAFAKAFVELQRGQEQFGREMGVRAIKEFTPLHAAGDPTGVLRYLLDWREPSDGRVNELVGTFADLMIHQVALINGMMEGVRAMLFDLSPEQIESQVTSTWPVRSSHLWRSYVDTYESLTEDDRKISNAIFGQAFVRAYSEYGGQENND